MIPVLRAITEHNEDREYRLSRVVERVIAAQIAFIGVSPFGQVVIEFSLHRPGARIELPARSTSKTDSVCLTLAGEWPTKFRMPATK